MGVFYAAGCRAARKEIPAKPADGTGRKNDPFRFWLPEKDDAFSNDFTALLERLMRENMERQRGLGQGEG
jgi:hypothetical protein